MKLTPEQKAFLEYGKAIATLEYRIERIRFTARMLFRKEYRELSRRFRGGLRGDFELYCAIGDVRRKRAECKRWNPPGGKACENCKHTGTVVGDPCFSCCFPYQGEPDYCGSPEIKKKNRERKMKGLRLPAAERSDACPRNMKPE